MAHKVQKQVWTCGQEQVWNYHSTMHRPTSLPKQLQAWLAEVSTAANAATNNFNNVHCTNYMYIVQANTHVEWSL